MHVRLATRGSALALWQANHVADLIRSTSPGVEVSLVKISTRPDRQPETPLDQLGGDKGLFVKEVEDAILNGDADAAIHSLKDVPAELPETLALMAFPERADARDVLVTPNGQQLTELPNGAVVATSSLRRRGQLLRLRSDLQMVEIRGNVDTRLRKLQSGEYNAIVLAAAGLGRLNLLDQNAQFLDPDLMIPAAGQGILAIESFKSSKFDALWKRLDDSQVRTLSLIHI